MDTVLRQLSATASCPLDNDSVVCSTHTGYTEDQGRTRRDAQGKKLSNKLAEIERVDGQSQLARDSIHQVIADAAMPAHQHLVDHGSSEGEAERLVK